MDGLWKNKAEVLLCAWEGQETPSEKFKLSPKR